MGRKGVSKRKLPKSKNAKVSNESGIGAASSIVRVTDAVPQSIAKGEAISLGKKKKK